MGGDIGGRVSGGATAAGREGVGTGCGVIVAATTTCGEDAAAGGAELDETIMLIGGSRCAARILRLLEVYQKEVSSGE